MNWPAIENAINAWIAAGAGSGVTVIWGGQGGPRPAVPFISCLVTSMAVVGRDWVSYEDDPITFDDITIESVDHATDTLTASAHGRSTGDGPVRLTTTGTLPTGLVLATDYWIIRSTADTWKLAASFQLAMAAAPTAVAFSSAGSGIHTLSDTASTTAAGAEILHTARGVRSLALSIQCFADGPLGAASAAAILANVVAAVNLPTGRDALVAAGLGFIAAEQIQGIGAVLGVSTWEPRAVTTVRFSLASEVSEAGTYIEIVEDPVGTVSP